MSDRFVLIDSYNATKVLGTAKHNIYDRCVAVVDTAATPPSILRQHYDDSHGTMRFAYDSMVHHLNELARELECERAEVRSLSDANAKLLAEIECWRVGARDLSNVIKTGSEANKKQHEEIVKLRAEVERWKREFGLCPRY